MRLGVSVFRWKMNFIGLENLCIRYGILSPEVELSPYYVDDKAGSEIVDSPSQLIILAWMAYINDPARSKPLEWLRGLEPAFDKAMRWLCAHCNDGLLVENMFGAWYDHIALIGPVLYSNMLFHQAVKCLAAIKSELGRETEAQNLNTLANALRARIIAGFWNERKGYFQVQPDLDVFHTEGNALAILFDFVDETKSRRISRFIEQTMAPGPQRPQRFQTGTCYPLHSAPHAWWFFNFIDLEGYQNYYVWSWVSLLQIAARVKIDGPTVALASELDFMERALVRDGTMFEIYEPWGAPVRTSIYKSEPGFSEASGMYLMTVRTLEEGKVPFRFI